MNFYLTPVSRLEPVNMVDVGRVTEVQGWSFTAGNLPVRLAERMAAACCAHLRGIDIFVAEIVGHQFILPLVVFSQMLTVRGYKE